MSGLAASANARKESTRCRKEFARVQDIVAANGAISRIDG
jgi:hypothetical protein